MKYPSTEAKAKTKEDGAKENHLIGQLYNKVDTIDEFKVKADLQGFSTHKIWSIVAFYFIWPRFDFIATIIISLTSLGLAIAFFMREHTSENPQCVLGVIFGFALGALLGFLLTGLLYAIVYKIKEVFNLEVPEK